MLFDYENVMRRLLHLLGNIPEDELLLSLYSSRKSFCSIYLKWLCIPSHTIFCYSEKGRTFLYKYILDRDFRGTSGNCTVLPLHAAVQSSRKISPDSSWILLLFSHCSGWKSFLHYQGLHLAYDSCESLLSSFFNDTKFSISQETTT